MRYEASSMRILALTVLTVVAAFTLTASAADEEKPSENAVFNFDGKIVVLVIDQSNALEQRQNTEVLENASVRKIGGRYFITGSAYSPPDIAANWRTGSEVGVAWETVHTYYAYTPEKFQNYAKRWSESEDE